MGQEVPQRARSRHQGRGWQHSPRGQQEEEISHSTAASPENKGLDKMVPKDPCGSDTSKHEKRARVRMQVIGRTWASSEKIYGAESRGPSRPGDWYKGWFEIGAPTENFHTVSSLLPMTVVLGQDQHTVDYVMNTDINCDLKSLAQDDLFQSLNESWLRWSTL